MPRIAKTFSPRKSRSGPLSTNTETARTREICQSRTGWDAARARTLTKYRTRRSRAISALRKRSEWSQLSSADRSEQENRIVDELAIHETEELEAIAKEWAEMVCGKEWIESKEEGVDANAVQETTTTDLDVEEWNRIEEDEEDERSWQGIADGDSDGSQALEDEDIDVSDNEKFADANGEEIKESEVIEGLESIWNRHWEKIERNLDLWEKLDD